MSRLFPPKIPATLPVIGVEVGRDDIIQALDYVSEKLCRKSQHITLVIAGDALSCLHFHLMPTCNGISMLPASTLSPPVMAILAKTVMKAQKKFGLGMDWINNQLELKIEKSLLDQIVQRSLVQNEVVYSSEGLTLLAVDFFFGLKSKLEWLSQYSSVNGLDDTIAFLRRLVLAYRGRPLSKQLLKTVYPQIEVTDQTLLRVNAAYGWKYKARGIVGISDEFLEWRREGRVDLEIDVCGLPTVDSDKTDEIVEQSSLPSFPSRPKYVIDYSDAGSAASSRACSPIPRSQVDALEIDTFLSVFNDAD